MTCGQQNHVVWDLQHAYAKNHIQEKLKPLKCFNPFAADAIASTSWKLICVCGDYVVIIVTLLC